jgi:3-phosphoshikimate 1-carboxyvinyltransferase
MLPELIEIVPLDKPVRAEITVPGSKSITNRALILAALADGETTLRGALWSEDTQVMADCLEKLGFAVTMKPDPDEFCNRTITVKGLGGKIPKGGTADKPLELFVGNAGTAARFLSAMVCLGNGVYRLSGVPRMHERPQAALFKALRELGYRVESENGNDKLPARIFADAPLSDRSRGNGTHSKTENQSLLSSAPANSRRRSCTVSIEESSQFASALLLCARVGQWKVHMVGENAEESPYVAMTTKMIEAFPKGGGTFQIEPDASSGSYFIAAGKIVGPIEFLEYSEHFGVEVPTSVYNTVKVAGWPETGWQIDANFNEVLPFGGRRYQLLIKLKNEGAHLDAKEGGRITEEISNPCADKVTSRKTDLGDSIMTAIVITPLDHEKATFTDLGRLRVQETERVEALRTELTKCGAKVVEEGDTLTVYPSELHGAEIETYNDHRMAMCFAILGLKVPGIKIKNPACVKKTFPNFFQKLAAPPPHGLGVTIRDAKTGRKLEEAELFAD